jgi:hypothetical protein
MRRLSWFDYPNNVWRAAQIMKLPTMQSPPVLCNLVPLRPKCSPWHPILEHPQPVFFLQCKTASSTPIQKLSNTFKCITKMSQFLTDFFLRYNKTKRLPQCSRFEYFGTSEQMLVLCCKEITWHVDTLHPYRYRIFLFYIWNQLATWHPTTCMSNIRTQHSQMGHGSSGNKQVYSLPRFRKILQNYVHLQRVLILYSTLKILKRSTKIRVLTEFRWDTHSFKVGSVPVVVHEDSRCIAAYGIHNFDTKLALTSLDEGNPWFGNGQCVICGAVGNQGQRACRRLSITLWPNVD